MTINEDEALLRKDLWYSFSFRVNVKCKELPALMTLNIGFRHATPPPKERERERKTKNTPFPSRHADPVWCALAMAHECRKPSGLQYVHVKKTVARVFLHN